MRPSGWNHQPHKSLKTLRVDEITSPSSSTTRSANDIDWDGPDVIARTPLDFTPFLVDVKIEEFKKITAGLAGGPKASATMGPASMSVKDGVYITVDNQGIKEIGTKVNVSTSAGAGGMKVR